jgi:hypothetical protein
MPQLGKNIRSVAPLSARERVRAFWVGVFGCELVMPLVDLDVFIFRDGSRIGVYLVPDEAALSPDRQREAGTWIEVCVDDLGATHTAINAAGVEPLPYHDDAHRYYQAPGGQVFRLAS